GFGGPAAVEVDGVDRIVAEIGHHAVLETVARPEQDDEHEDAPRDGESREDGAEFVAAHRGPDLCEQLSHRAASAVGVMLPITPSFRRMILSVWSAIDCSCVTQMMVMPMSVFTLRRRFITSCDVALSSAPVGSSARMILGLLISARAIATRCFWPPDISLGMCPAHSLSPS